MRARVLQHSGQSEVDEGFEGSLLLSGMQRPLLVELDLAVLAPGEYASEVLKAVRGDERVAFEVEKDVARRRLWQPCEAAAGSSSESNLRLPVTVTRSASAPSSTSRRADSSLWTQKRSTSPSTRRKKARTMR